MQFWREKWKIVLTLGKGFLSTTLKERQNRKIKIKTKTITIQSPWNNNKIIWMHIFVCMDVGMLTLLTKDSHDPKNNYKNKKQKQQKTTT